MTARTIGCPITTHSVHVTNWSLDGRLLPSLTVITQPAPAILKRLPGGAQFGGLLGADVLSRLRSVTIDFAHRRVVIGAQAFSGGRELPLDVLDRKGAVAPLARITINGRVANYVVDTGSSRTLLARRAAKSFGLPVTDTDQSITGAGGCAARVATTRIAHWSIATTTLPPLTVETANTDLFRPRAHGGLDGLLGDDVLSRYPEATVDFRQRQLVLGGTLR
jgi:hypothetical protein